MIRFIDLKAQYDALRDPIHAGIDRVLEHGQYIMGPEVAQLEERLADYVGTGHCITVASGTEALLIALMALGVGPGDEVITTPFTFVATAEVIALAGATPVFVDVERDTCNINASLIAQKITSRTKAIIPVSLYGQVADMEEIEAAAAPYGVPVIEDAAQSFGADYKGRKSCGTSLIGCTSFFPSKPLGCYGDGGAIFTPDAGLAQAMREIRTHGQEKRYYHTRVGVGGRMDTLQCAIVLAKFGRFDWEVERRRAIGERYSQAFEAVGIQTTAVREDRTCVWGQYTIQVADRAAFQEKLKAAGIPTAIHYPRPLHRQPAYAAYGKEAHLPVSDLLAERVLSLPMSADLNEKDQDHVIAAVIAASER